MQAAILDDPDNLHAFMHCMDKLDASLHPKHLERWSRAPALNLPAKCSIPWSSRTRTLPASTQNGSSCPTSFAENYFARIDAESRKRAFATRRS